MKKKPTLARLSTIAAILLILVWGSAEHPARGEEAAISKDDSAWGELKIEGRHIRRLILDSSEGDHKEIEQPGEVIKLPCAKYMLQEVHLEGGHSSRSWQLPARGWVTIGPDKPPVLKVGAPLKHKVQAKRQGRRLVLSYELLGIGGEKYTGASREKRPRFTVYAGQKKIADGSFEYG